MTSPTPLQLLARRTQPITDVVYGDDHPDKQPRRAQPAPQKRRVGSLVKDVLDPSILHKLQALQGKLEAQERRKRGKRGAS